MIDIDGRSDSQRPGGRTYEYQRVSLNFGRCFIPCGTVFPPGGAVDHFVDRELVQGRCPTGDAPSVALLALCQETEISSFSSAHIVTRIRIRSAPRGKDVPVPGPSPSSPFAKSDASWLCLDQIAPGVQYP